MKRLLIPFIVLTLILMTVVAAGAHGGAGFRVVIGLPLFFGYSYPAPYSYYQPRVRAYDDTYFTGTVVENIYVNGRLVERRIKVYGDRYGYDHERRYDRYGDYGRRQVVSM